MTKGCAIFLKRAAGLTPPKTQAIAGRTKVPWNKAARNTTSATSQRYQSSHINAARQLIGNREYANRQEAITHPVILYMPLEICSMMMGMLSPLVK